MPIFSVNKIYITIIELKGHLHPGKAFDKPCFVSDPLCVVLEIMMLCNGVHAVF